MSKYKIIKKIGSGAHSIVYLCRKDNVKYVIKQMDNYDQFEKIATEIKVLKKVKHENIIALLDVCYLSGTTLLVLPYLEDYTTLSDVNIKFKENIKIYMTVVLELVKTIDYLHSIPIYHMDIKPENILINNDKIKLIDFGLAIYKSEYHGQGTPYYASPEVWGKQKKLDLNKLEVWSLGITIYYIVNDTKMPFIAKDKDELKELVMNKEPNKSESSIIELDLLIMNMLNKDPIKRPKMCLILESIRNNNVFKLY